MAADFRGRTIPESEGEETTMDTAFRGFILRIQVGRAGLVTVTVLLLDGNIRQFVIEDLDADPERFNERLSKLAILRDAMTKSEPVEIRAEQSESGDSIVQVARLTRDAHHSASSDDLRINDGLVLSISLMSHIGIGGSLSIESADIASINLLTDDIQFLTLTLDMQMPERLMAVEMLRMLSDAEKEGEQVTVWHLPDKDQGRRIVGVRIGAADGDRETTGIELNGFVETLSLIRDFAANQTNLALVRFTTAPAFTGEGNTIGLAPFSPETVNLIIVKGSPVYALFEAALRDTLRMRIRAVDVRGDQKPRDPANGRQPVPASSSEIRSTRFVARTHAATAGPTGERADVAVHDSAVRAERQDYFLVLEAELVAPLASASRPVWITISREQLDNGPDGLLCTPGLPTSDLVPRSLRDLNIPYTAAWHGYGCFNHGVYRFQFTLENTFRVMVDGKELCLYESSTPPAKLAYACLEGDHHVVVEIEGWTCKMNYAMDVYRVR
jgi:hypothetical protein